MDGLKWYDSNNIIRANYDEEYKSGKFNSPKDIAIEYLKLNHEELGIDKELNGIQQINSQKSVNSENLYFKQYFNNIPIYGTEIILTVDANSTVTYVLNNCKNMQHIRKVYSNETIGEQKALEIALQNLGYDEKDMDHKISKVYVELENEELMLCWKLNFEGWIFLISAVDGEIHLKGSTVLPADIQTKVFAVNPLYTAERPYGWTGYIDNNDQTTSQLNAELMDVTLNDVTVLTSGGWWGYTNEYCDVKNIAAPNIDYNYGLSDVNIWYNNMDRGDDIFEVAMVLHHIETAGNWVDELGYMRWPLSDEVDVDPHASDPYYGDMGAWYYPGFDKIYFGAGGVDAAEDQTAIWHEYAHHINYELHPTRYDLQVFAIPTASLMEGFADYFAGSYKKTITGYDQSTVGEWGMAEYYIIHPEKRRRTDTDYVYPDDYSSVNYHFNGQIFSSALMGVRNNIGRYATDKILLESIKDWGNTPTLLSAGEHFYNAAEDLYEKEYLCECISNLKPHGLTQRPYTAFHGYVQDVTIQSSTVYNDYCAFTFENVTIDNSPNISVVVEAIERKTTIVKSFEVKLGSTFEVK
ncbi:hypothetical protein ACFLTA_09445 [Bacteroidota bacterium]